MSILGLPDDLEAITLARFDELVGKGEVLYRPTTIEIVNRDGFQVCCPSANTKSFRTTSILISIDIFSSFNFA